VLVDLVDTQVEDHPILVEPDYTQAEPVVEDQLEGENPDTVIKDPTWGVTKRKPNYRAQSFDLWARKIY